MLINNVFVRKIYQNDNCVFTIEWNDGKISRYRLSELQKRCNCARCVDEKTGKRLVDPSQVPDDLVAKKIFNVGRYALKIDYASGCSRGIYPFSFLRELN
jgi:ATP-binding protein involved in chromosome partitioning